MVLLTQTFIQWTTMFMEDGTIKLGIALYKMVHNTDFTDISEKWPDHVL